MIIKSKRVNGIDVEVLLGKLDIFSKNTFRDLVDKYKKAGQKRLIVDLQGVSYIDSVGVGTLVVSAKTLQSAKAKLILVNPQDAVKRVLEQTNLGKLIPIFAADPQFTKFTEIV